MKRSEEARRGSRAVVPPGKDQRLSRQREEEDSRGEGGKERLPKERMDRKEEDKEKPRRQREADREDRRE